MGSCIICILNQAKFGDKIKKNVIGGACGTYGREMYMVFWWEDLSEKYHLEVLGIDGWIVLKWDLKR